VGKKARRRMSDTLIEFARPELLREGGSVREWQFELTLASVVWNGVLTGLTAEAMLKELSEGREPDAEFAELIANLVRRRQTTFAHDKRFVVAAEAYPTADGVHVMAASVM
jgi:hypothetical protein